MVESGPLMPGQVKRSCVVGLPGRFLMMEIIRISKMVLLILSEKGLSMFQVWQTAALYHLIHSTALLSAPMVKHPNIFGGLLTPGILAFSRTLISRYFD